MTEQHRDGQGQFAASSDWFSALVAGNPPATDPKDLPSDWLVDALRGTDPAPAEPPTDTPTAPPTTPKGRNR